MDNMKAIIIEDEPQGIKNLVLKLKESCPEIEVVQSCRKPEEGIKAIQRYLPDVVFLDIQLGSMSGFEVLERISNINFEVIFTTSYDDYAIQAIKVSALDYLIKPIDEDELVEAVSKAKQKLWEKRERRNPLTKLAVPAKSGLVFLPIDEIVDCEADDNYTHIYMVNGKKHLVSKTLAEVEKKLTSHNFSRIHKSHMVNLDHLESYTRGDGGYVTMKNDKTINVSRSRREAFLRQVEGR